jgi:lipooligosaccharide transport system permease protein
VTAVRGAPTSSPLRPFEGTRLLVLRNYVTYRTQWKLFLTGFLEPVFYLFSIGIGVG